MCRIFPEFPNHCHCPICGTNRNMACFLIPIDGTDEGKICEAQPMHVVCVRESLAKFRWNRDAGLIYMRSVIKG